jgi:WD40 repeat protein
MSGIRRAVPALALTAALGAHHAMGWSPDSPSASAPCLAFVALGHTGPITAFSWSPTGRVLATGSEDHIVILWDAVTWKQRAILSGLASTVRALAWSNDGTALVASGENGGALVWDARTGQPRVRLGTNADQIRLVAWGADAKTVLTVGSSQAALWDTVTGKSRAQIGLKSARPEAWITAVSPDGGVLALAQAPAAVHGSLSLWDMRSGKLLAVPEQVRGTVTALAWSPHGRLLAAAERTGRITVCGRHGGTRRANLALGRGGVGTMTWSPDETILAAQSADGGSQLMLWDVANGRRWDLGTSKDPDPIPLAWQPGSNVLATASGDGRKTVLLWDASSGRRLRELSGHSSAVLWLAWSPDGTKLAATDGQGTLIWDPGSSRPRATVDGLGAPLLWNPRRRTLVGSQAGSAESLMSYDGASGSRRTICLPHSGPVSPGCIAWSPDGATVAAGCTSPQAAPQSPGDITSAVALWDVHTGSPRTVINPGPGQVSAVDWSPNGRFIGIATSQFELAHPGFADPGAYMVLRGGGAGLWEAPAGRPLVHLPGGAARLSWSPVGSTVATSSLERTVVIWDAETGGRRSTLAVGSYNLTLAWRPDGKALITNIYSNNRWGWALWDIPSGQRRATIDRPTGPFPCLAWRPDGGALAMSASAASVVIADPASPAGGAPPHPATGSREPSAGPVSLAWSPDGKILASGARGDPVVRMWKGDSAGLLAAFRCMPRGVNVLAWSPDGRWLACGGDDHTVVLWDPVARKRHAVLRGHTGPVTALAWGPARTTLCSASADGSVRLWDAERRRELASFYVIDGGKEWLTVTPEGYFQASDHGVDFIGWRRGTRLLRSGRVRGRFERPDLVRRALNPPATRRAGHLPLRARTLGVRASDRSSAIVLEPRSRDHDLTGPALSQPHTPQTVWRGAKGGAQ